MNPQTQQLCFFWLTVLHYNTIQQVQLNSVLRKSNQTAIIHMRKSYFSYQSPGDNLLPLLITISLFAKARSTETHIYIVYLIKKTNGFAN